jgi:hypothetical protein
MARRVIIGHHRSADLAERHRRQLERDSGVPVGITSRRNATGAYSTRGHTFTFEFEEEDDYVDIIGIDSLYE